MASPLHASGGMTWALDLPEALAQVPEYEFELHRHFGPRLTGLCQYDLDRFQPELLSDVIRIHPKLIATSWKTPFTAPPTNSFKACPTVTLAHIPGVV